MTRTAFSLDCSSYFGRKHALSGRNQSTGKTVVKSLTRRDYARSFGPVAREYSTGDLAQGAGRAKETTKQWRAETSIPDTEALMNMARSLPSVRGWAIAEMADEQLLLFLATYPGPEGEWARAALTKMAESKGQI